MDVLVFAETKLDGSFQDAQFSIPGFKMPYRLDISGSSGGMLVFVNVTFFNILISFDLD